MGFAMIDASGPIISAKISGKLVRSEVSQMQSAAVDAIGAAARPARCSFSKISRVGNATRVGATSAS
jgi:hypothetical protein